ncbi:MAG: LPS-assembly protein LptD [Treponema sp.]
MKKIAALLFCLFFLLLCVEGFSQEKKQTKTITIHSVRVMALFKKENKAQHSKQSDTEQADKTEEAAAGTSREVTAEDAQKAVDEKKDEIIVFSGGVSISVKEGSAVTAIKADKVTYNRSANTIEAEGNVRYSRKIGSADAEEFAGALFSFHIDEMEGVFLDGTLKQPPRKKGDNPFVVRSNTVGRDSSGTTGFKNGILTTSKDPDEDPLWSIRASRIWMLPGNELAFVNGYFSIGIVPLFYLPFFYHPADEMIFHPVFGFRNRQGAFIQTTTYLIGRKPLDQDSKKSGSFSNFMKSDKLKKQERIGLFLKNLDEDETNIDPAYVKLIADWYALLGGLVGIDGKFVPKNSPVKQVDFSLYLGMSRTLYPPSPGQGTLLYSAYDSQGKRHYNKGTIYGFSVPFRYRTHFNFTLSQSPMNFSVTMPLISDPFFKQDFFDRSEDMNWFSYLLNRDKLAKGADIGKESSYAWKVNGSLRPSFKILSPWISTFNIDTLSILVDFASKNTLKIDPFERDRAPHREFFYPRLFKPEGKVSIAGTLLSNTLFTRKEHMKNQNTPADTGIANPFEHKDSNTENADPAEPEATKTNAQEQVKKQNEYLDLFLPVFRPVYGKNFDHSIIYSLTYSGDFSALQETSFASSLWNNPEDIKWKEYESRYYQLRGNAGLKGAFSYSQNLIAVSSGLMFSGNYQRHPWTREDSKRKNLELNNYKANIYTLKNENSVTVNPFVYTDMFKPISFTWTIHETLVKNTFTGTYNTPEWKTEKAKWDKDFITTHSGTAVFGVILAEKYTQKISFSTNLPPLLQAYSGSMELAFPYGTFTASTKIFEKEKAKKKWFWDPFKMEISWQFPYNIKMGQLYIYNIEEKSSERLHLTLNWLYFSAFYTHSREIPYDLVQGRGWVPKSAKKEFIPFAAGFSFSNTSKPLTLYAWKNRIQIQLGLTSNLHFNLIRTTDSYFTFTPKFIFNIHEFWDFSFGTSSRNDVIARYFQKLLRLPVVIPGNSNIFTDLAHSFYFWDRKKREASGFKLQSLDIGLTHYLKDWVLKLNCQIKPEQKQDGVRRYYVFTPAITFAVEWKPIGDIKVEAKKKDGKFSVERGEIR